MHQVIETDYWFVNHRKDSRYPGYLMVGLKSGGSTLSGMSDVEQVELGKVLAKTESMLIDFYNPYRVITAKLGFSEGHSCHFHVLPVSEALLEEIRENPSYSDEPDGNDVLLFVSREYCERELTELENKKQLELVNELKSKS